MGWSIYFLPDEYIAKLICAGVLGCGHSPLGAGVAMTTVEASNVGVKVGMVGRGVMDAVGVVVGTDVFVLVGIGGGADVDSRVTGTGVTVAAGTQAVSIKIPLNRAINIGFNGFLPKYTKLKFFSLFSPQF